MAKQLVTGVLSSFAAIVVSLACLALVQWPKGIDCGWSCRSNPIPWTKPTAQEMEDYCRLHNGFSWEDFRNKGYTVIPGFIPREDIDTLLDVRNQLPDDSVINPGGNGGQRQGYQTPALSGQSLRTTVPHVLERILNITHAAAAEADIHIPHPKEEEVFFTTNSSNLAGSLNFYWHQDVENYFFFQDLHNYLDFYIYLFKPYPNQAGISIVPWDALRAHSPQLYNLVKRRDKVHNFNDIGGGNMVVGEFTEDRTYFLDWHIDHLACSPDLHEGDMILFAGDAIHRTQEHTSERISLNINVHEEAEHSQMSIWQMLRGGMWKYYFMKQNAPTYIMLHLNRIMRQYQLEYDDYSRRGALAYSALSLCIDLGYSYRRALWRLRLKSDSVYLCDVGQSLLLWVGKRASDRERRAAMSSATRYLRLSSRPLTTPVCMLGEGQTMRAPFSKVFAN